MWRDGGGGRGAELREDFSAKDLRGSIALGILHSPPITAGEEKHITTAHQLHQIVVEITCLLSILKDKQQATRALCGQTAKEHRGTGAQQTIEENRAIRRFPHLFCQCRHLRQLCV